MDWNKWLTIIALLALLTAIGAPIAQKKYEEWKARISFKLYLKKYFGIIFNILTYDKIEYTKPSIKDEPKKLEVTLPIYLKHFENDFKDHQNTLQTRVAFTVLFNLQNLFSVINRIQLAILGTQVDNLYEHTLAYGNSISKKDLNKIYGILLLMEHFNSITTFHDRFTDLKSIKRVMKDKVFVGLKVEKSMLKNQQIVAEDLKHLCNNELSIEEVIKINRLLIQEMEDFFGYDKLKKKKNKK